LKKFWPGRPASLSVSAGEIVECRVDLAEVNDLYLQTIRSFYDMGGRQVYDPGRITFILDHYAPAATIQQAENQKQMRRFCRDQGIELLFDIGSGVCHQVMVDEGLVYPGMVLVATDSHTTTHGAFGAFGTSASGPRTLRLLCEPEGCGSGCPKWCGLSSAVTIPGGVYAKDIILSIIGDLGADYAIYKAVEFSGPILKDLSVSERMALCNMTTEMGAKTSYIQPDETTVDFLRPKREAAITRYSKAIRITDTVPSFPMMFPEIEPQLSAPHSVDNVAPISRFEGTPVDQAYLGSCTGGRTEDLGVAAQILKGKKVHARYPAGGRTGVKERFPGKLWSKGISTSWSGLERRWLPRAARPVWGPMPESWLPEKFVSASTNRNFPGRMGHSRGRNIPGVAGDRGRVRFGREKYCQSGATSINELRGRLG
jgi:homoaconitase/3-isopropylmalate dehydratase large subunit